MNRIIALRGRGNSGKTTTIRMLPAILTANGFTSVPGSYRDYTWDFLEIFQNADGLKLGVTSCGDNYDNVLKRLNDLVNAGCTICICACRTHGGTNTAAESIPGFTVQYIEKNYANTNANEDAVNRTDANNVFIAI